jgi:hypothetical protein
MINAAAIQNLSRTLRIMGLFGALAALAWSPAGCAADAAKRYPLAQSGFLQLKVPAGWREEIDAQTQPPVISFRPGAGQPFLVSVIPAQAAEGNPTPSRQELRADVEQMAGAIRPFAVESEIKPMEFAGAAGPGFQFFATDAAPRPGEFKYMTRGKLKVGDVSVTFTILTNEGQEAVVRSALAMLKSASRVR